MVHAHRSSLPRRQSPFSLLSVSPTPLSEASVSIDSALESPFRVRGVSALASCRYYEHVYRIRRSAETCGCAISISFRVRHQQNLFITPGSWKGVNANSRRLERGSTTDQDPRVRAHRRVLLRPLTKALLRAKMKCLPPKLPCSWRRIPKSVHQTVDLPVTNPVLGTTCTLHPKVPLWAEQIDLRTRSQCSSLHAGPSGCQSFTWTSSSKPDLSIVISYVILTHAVPLNRIRFHISATFAPCHCPLRAT